MEKFPKPKTSRLTSPLNWLYLAKLEHKVHLYRVWENFIWTWKRLGPSTAILEYLLSPVFTFPALWFILGAATGAIFL
jgi:hypothetical protein